jgi:hypothetical protein
MICIHIESIHRLSEKTMKIKCGCHCIKCKSTNLESNKIGITENDGYFDMHHTCQQCNTHFDHLDGEIFANCSKCNYSSN